jgi:hypothetical protein
MVRSPKDMVEPLAAVVEWAESVMEATREVNVTGSNGSTKY